MSGQDTSEIRVASFGDIYVAPVGTSLPTTSRGSLDNAFYQVGLVTEDGVTISAAPEIQEFNAWQRRQPVRRELIGQAITATFAMEQWNAETIALAFGGGEVSEPSPGEFRYDFPDNDASLDERAMVIDWQDGPDHEYRLVFPRGNVSEAVEFQLVRNNLSVLPVTFAVLSPETGVPAYLLAGDSEFHS